MGRLGESRAGNPANAAPAAEARRYRPSAGHNAHTHREQSSRHYF